MKYKILIARTAIELSEGVNRHIEKEWQPLGSIACTTGADGITLYMQALESHRAVDAVEVAPAA